jgi:hypothetical protein
MDLYHNTLLNGITSLLNSFELPKQDCTIDTERMWKLNTREYPRFGI